MTRLNWGRRGPPRSGASRGGHPHGFERPYVHVTDEDRRRRRQELAEERRNRPPYLGPLETYAAIEERLLELQAAGVSLNDREQEFLAEQAKRRAYLQDI